MTEFEQQVLADLATLKSEMRSLLGNGQPGRLAHLEKRVEKHETALHRAGGLGMALGGALTLLHLGIDFLKLHK